LREIWQADPAGGDQGCPTRLLGIIKRHVAQTWKRWDVDPDVIEEKTKPAKLGDDASEKSFTPQGMLDSEEFDRMSAARASIGRVCDATAAHLGSGFLIAGDLLKKGFGKSPVFVTNAHVLSSVAPDAVRPADARITFEIENRKLEEPKYYKVSEVLLTSEPGAFGDAKDKRLDVCIVRLKATVSHKSALLAAPKLPEIVNGARAYVIGYPQGSGLRISLHDSALIDIDADQRRLHYRTPTDHGNSGSPVFDERINVIGVHRGGSREMRRLKGQGTYEANEGISLQAIRKLLNA
jgi:V8-like Glu-specific endopeptidase